jgi:hypothetical protein
MANILIRNQEAFKSAAEKQASEAVQVFCQTWAMTSEGLVLLKQIAPAIPTVGRFVGFAIDIVISAGNSAYKVLCHSAGDSEVAP